MLPHALKTRFGRHVFGLGIITIGSFLLVVRDFIPGQPVSKHFPARAALACTAGAFLVASGIAVQLRRAAAGASAALSAYFLLIVVLLMNTRVLLAHYREFGAYSGLAEQLAIAGGAVILYATYARIDAVLAARLTRFSQAAFGICALLFGGAHFVYMNLTAPLVPRWLPPSQLFWGYATGVAFLAAGMALLTRIQARLAAVLLTAMIASFALLIHLPMLYADHTSRMNWSEAATNLAILGATWVLADSLKPSRLTA